MKGTTKAEGRRQMAEGTNRRGLEIRLIDDFKNLVGVLNPNGARHKQQTKIMIASAICLPSALKILLCFCAPLVLGSFAVVSVAAPQATAQVTAIGNINRPNLKVGSKGEPVSELQAALKLLGFYTGKVDGVYNNTTASAVSQFKQSIGLKPDGIVDASTWQGLFPSDPIVASTDSSTRARNFPVPTETNTTTQVTNSDNESTATQTTTTRVTNSDNESTATQTTTNTTRVTNSDNEPRTTTRTTTNTTKVNPNNEPRTTTRTTTNTTRVNPRNEPRPAKPNTTREQRTASQQSSLTRTQPTRTQSNIRNQQAARTQSYVRTQSTTRTTNTPAIQYTSEGLPILRVGMSGSEVVRLQQRLQRLGYIDDIDGDFGVETEAAVRSLQRRYGLEADGVVGGATWDILSRRRRVN